MLKSRNAGQGHWTSGKLQDPHMLSRWLSLLPFSQHLKTSSFIIKTKSQIAYIKRIYFILRASLPSSAGDGCLRCVYVYMLFIHTYTYLNTHTYISTGWVAFIGFLKSILVLIFKFSSSLLKLSPKCYFKIHNQLPFL